MKRFLLFIKKILLGILVLALILYFGATLYLYLSQSKLIYRPAFPTREIISTPDSEGMTYEEVSLCTSDSVILHGWFIPAETAQFTVLFCHGNAGNISHRIESIKIFHELGFNTFIFDYRGYGKSQGIPFEQGLYTDVMAAWDHLVNARGIADSNIIIMGRSLGGAVAAWCAIQHTPRLLILESTFTSIPDIAVELYPMFPVRLFCTHQYKTLSYITKIQCPVLIIHSPEDEVVPMGHAFTLFDQAPEPKYFLEISGSHDDGAFQSQDWYQTGIKAFIQAQP